MVARRIRSFGVGLIVLLGFFLPRHQLVGDVILSDIVAGGDGTGTAPPNPDPGDLRKAFLYSGINPDTGKFEEGFNSGNTVNTGDNPQAVAGRGDADDSPYIDQVFILDRTPFPINTAGVMFDFAPGDPNAGTWDYILADRTHDRDKGNYDISMDGITYEHGVGIHASAGITFDLEPLRVNDPREIGLFTAVMGMDRCAGHINTYILVSDDEGIIDAFHAELRGNSGSLVQVFIPAEARYLTIAVGAAGDGIGCDHGVFAELRLTKAPRAKITRSVPKDLINGGTGTVTLKVEPEFGGGVVILHETPPAGLVPTAPSNGGTVAAGSIDWNLGKVTSTIELTYKVTADHDANDGSFTSTATADGEEVIVGGDFVYNGAPINSKGFIKLWSHLGPLAYVYPPVGGDNGISCLGQSADPNDPTVILNDLSLDWIVNEGGTIDEATILPFPGMVVRPKYGGDGLPGGTGARAAGLVLEAGDTGAVSQDRYPVWREGLSRSGTVTHDDAEVIGFAADDHCSMSSVYVTNTTQEAILTQIGFASDDSIQIFLNDEDVTQGGRNVCRGYGNANEEQDMVPATLPVGESRLLVKVTDGGGVSGFRLRFQDPSLDQTLPGLTSPTITVSTESARNRTPGSVRRSFAKPSYTLNEKVEVSLTASLAPAANVTIIEPLPPQAVVGLISDGGTFQNGAVRWTLNGVGQKTVTYEIGGSNCSADLTFGLSSFIVGTNEVAITGSQVLTRSYTQEPMGAWDSRGIGGSGGSAEKLGDHAVLVQGTGDGVRLTKDSLQFLSVLQSGDFEFSARIDCFDDPGTTGVAGIMLRDSYDDNAVNVYLNLSSVPPAGGGVGTLKGSLRAVTGRSTSTLLLPSAPRDVTSLPVYLKIKRAGTSLTFQRSPDGLAWTDLATKVIGTATGQIQFGPDVFAGVGVTGGGGGSTRLGVSELSGPSFGGAPPGKKFRRGDVDASNAIDISDPVGILGYLFQGAGAPACLEAADTDNSGEVDISDAVNSLSYQFLGGPPPAAPGPDACGADPTAPFLGCDQPCP